MTKVTISFVDVGQGDCTTVVDANGFGILIDCPAGADNVAFQELDLQNCTSLRAAVVTHSDQDHAGGLLDVLERLAERFDGRLYFTADSLQATPVAGPDRRVEGRKKRAFLLRALEYKERLSPSYVIDQSANEPNQIGIIRWRFLSPTFGEVIDAMATGNPNLASAVVVISVFDQNIVISGDAQLSAWEKISGSLPTSAIVRWPHHGGSIGGGSQAEAQRRLFEICKPSHVILSVGSRNNYGHPSEEFFIARHAAGCALICTEASTKCVLGGAMGKICAGTIRITLTESGEDIATSTPDHAQRIRELGSGRCINKYST